MYRVVAVAVLLVPALAHADRRAYGTTYEAVLAPKGELDVELWSTYSRLGEIDGGPASRGLRQMVELEYGITDRWDAALYNMVDVTSTDESDSGYAGFKIETRFRPSFPGEWFVDPVFYFEFQDLFRGDANQTYELKLILAKNIGPVNVSLNISGEEERTTDATWNLEIEHAEGVSYELSPAWKVGLETFGKEERDMGVTESRLWGGPAVSWARGPTGPMRGLWVTVAAGGRLAGGEDADAYYGRLIVGLQF
jgi:hypothetical protein